MYEKILEFMKQKPSLYAPNMDKFWDDEHISKQMLDYHYAETCNHLDQYIVISDDTCRCFNIWNQSYDSISLGRELYLAGFKDLHFYDDVCGKSLSDDSNTICVVAR